MKSAGFKRGESRQLHLLPEIEQAIKEADAAQFRSTKYETIAPLLRTLKLPGGHYVEPCAGDGDILEHIARGAREGITPLPSFWTAIELRKSTRLHLRRIRGLDHVCAQFDVDVHDRQDFLSWTRRDESVSLVLTNWPWYGISELVEHAFEIYPRADVLGLCCSREPLDGCEPRSPSPHEHCRPRWFERHAPDWYVCHGRQKLACMRSGTPTNGYPHPVAWLHWPRDGRNRSVGSWRVLPPYGPASTARADGESGL